MTSLPSSSSVSNSMPNATAQTDYFPQPNDTSVSLVPIQQDSSRDSAMLPEEDLSQSNDSHALLEQSQHDSNRESALPEDSTEWSRTEDEQNQEQMCIPESHSSLPIESSQLEGQKGDTPTDIQENNLACSESQPMNEKKDFSGDITSFLETVYDLLECPVCLNHMVPPILLCESGHNVCFKCRPFMTKCPLCRRSFLQTRNIALEVVAQKLGLQCTHEDCHKGCFALKDESEQQLPIQMTYTCPLTLYTHCYWQGNYSEIRRHIEEMHPSRILTEEVNPTWEIKLVVRDCRVIFALGEIFFYKERLDTTNSKFFIQVFYVGQEGNHNRFVYHLNISSKTGQQKFAICNSTLPINDLEHAYTYSVSHCTVLDYHTISSMSKHGDLKCTLSLERHLRE